MAIAKITRDKIELEKELDLKHEKSLRRFHDLRDKLELHYKGWYIAIDPDSGVYMVEADLMKFYCRINAYFPKIIDLGLFRLHRNIYIGKI